MADELNPTPQEPPLMLDVNQHHELQYWCRKWGVTADQVRAAVLVVGGKVENVRRYLNK